MGAVLERFQSIWKRKTCSSFALDAREEELEKNQDEGVGKMAESVAYHSRTVEPIVLDNLVLDGEAERGADGSYLLKNQREWEEHFAGMGKRIPTVSEYVRFIDYTRQNNRPAFNGIMRDLEETWLCAGKIDYSKSNLPVGNGPVDQLLEDPFWQIALEDELFHYNAQRTVALLQEATGKRPYILTPDASGRKSLPERAVWLYIGADWFLLNCYGDPIDGNGRARGVREVGAAGAREKYVNPPCRTPATKPEEVLEGKLVEIISPFRQLKAPATAELYDGLEQQALRELTELYTKNG